MFRDSNRITQNTAHLILMFMMDAISKPRKPISTRTTTSKQKQGQPHALPTNTSKSFTPEMKVWLSVVGATILIVGVWVATFSIPQSKRSDTTSSSELASILTELRETMKTNIRAVEDQKRILTAQGKQRGSILSNEELTKLASELIVHASTTTSTVPVLTPQTKITKPSTQSPKLP